DAGGEQSRALLRARLFALLRALRARPRQRQNLHAGVIVIKDLALRGLAEQFVESGPHRGGDFLDDLPLGRGRQGNPQTRLQSFQPVKGYPATVLQQRDHRRRRLVVLLLAHARRSCRFKNLAAQVAAETFQFIDRGRNRRLAHHPDAQSGFLLFVNFALLALRTMVSRLERSVRDLDPASPAIRRGAVSAVSRLGRARRVRRRTVFRRGLDPRLLQHLTRLLRARFRQQRPQAANRGVLLPDHFGQETKGSQRRLELLITLLVQGLLTRPLQQRFPLLQVHLDHLARGLHPNPPPATSESAA